MADTYQEIEKVIAKLKIKINSVEDSTTDLRTDRDGAARQVRHCKETLDEAETEGSDDQIEHWKDMLKVAIRKLKKTSDDLTLAEAPLIRLREMLHTAQNELKAYATGKGKLTKGSKTYEKDKKKLQDKITCLNFKIK